MEEVLGAIKLALSEEGFTIDHKLIGKHRYLIVQSPHHPNRRKLVGIVNNHNNPDFIIPLAHPQSLEHLIAHLTESLTA